MSFTVINHQKNLKAKKDAPANLALIDSEAKAASEKKQAEQHVSRSNNVYAYLADDNHVIDITNGDHTSIEKFVQHSKLAVLAINIDPALCFVSDLDAYDAVKQAVGASRADKALIPLAHQYWSKLTRLNQFNIGTITRPEVMITYDVSPDNLKQL